MLGLTRVVRQCVVVEVLVFSDAEDRPALNRRHPDPMEDIPHRRHLDALKLPAPCVGMSSGISKGIMLQTAVGDTSGLLR